MECERCGKEVETELDLKICLEIRCSERKEIGRSVFRDWGNYEDDEKILVCIDCYILIMKEHTLAIVKGNLEDREFELERMKRRYEERRINQAKAEEKMLKAKNKEIEKAKKEIEKCEKELLDHMESMAAKGR